MEIGDTLKQLLAGRPLTEAQASEAFELLLTGQMDPAQIAALLSLIQARGAAVDELVGAARVMRRHVTRLPVADGLLVLDTCGTGGAPKTFNVSTAVALVVAGAGAAAPGGRVVVAKHGNRSRTGRGSAEVLQKLGVNVDAPPEVQGRCLERAGVCFCFAIHHHPAARHAAGIRKTLGFPTIFNLLGPLTNPAGATRQLIGVYGAEWVEPVAQALARLGTQRAMVVHGQDGMDELSTVAPTFVAVVDGGTVRREVLDAAALGLTRPAPSALAAGDLESAAEIIRRVIGGEPGPQRDIVILNAGAALAIAGACATIADGMALAAAAIDSGRARLTLDRLAAESTSAA
jgi:anthranilate phosphoribosyltransferase